VPFRLDNGVEEAALPESAATPVLRVEPARVAAVQALETAAQREFRQADSDVVMRSENGVAEAFPGALLELEPEHPHEHVAVVVVGKCHQAGDRNRVHVVDGADLLDARRRAHRASVPTPQRRRNCPFHNRRKIVSLPLRVL
jgi:hypothetical protein